MNLPNNIEAERSIIASVLIDGNKMDQIHDIVSPSDFYLPQNKLIASAIWKLYSQNKRPDIVLIADAMGAENLAKVGGIGELAKYETESTANIECHARLVLSSATRRNVINNCINVIEKAKSDEFEPDEIITEAIRGINSCYPPVLSDAVHIRTVISSYMDLAKRRMEDGDFTGVGVPTGLTPLDLALSSGGISVGTLPTIIAGQPGDGKSSLAVNIAHNAAMAGGAVLYCTFEDLAQSPTVRMFSRVSGISNKQLQNAVIDFNDWERVTNAVSQIWNCNIYFMEKIPKSPEYLAGAIRRFCKIHRPILVIIDYLQMLRAIGRGKSAQEKIDDIFSSIVMLSRDPELTRTALVLLSQYRRRDRQIKPQNGDLYHSGSIEQGSASILHLWDPKLGTKFPVKMILVGKQKNGDRDLVVPVGWNGNTASFNDLDDAFYCDCLDRFWTEEDFLQIKGQNSGIQRYAYEMQKLLKRGNRDVNQ